MQLCKFHNEKGTTSRGRHQAGAPSLQQPTDSTQCWPLIRRLSNLRVTSHSEAIHPVHADQIHSVEKLICSHSSAHVCCPDLLRRSFRMMPSADCEGQQKRSIRGPKSVCLPDRRHDHPLVFHISLSANGLKIMAKNMETQF